MHIHFFLFFFALLHWKVAALYKISYRHMPYDRKWSILHFGFSLSFIPNIYISSLLSHVYSDQISVILFLFRTVAGMRNTMWERVHFYWDSIIKFLTFIIRQAKNLFLMDNIFPNYFTSKMRWNLECAQYCLIWWRLYSNPSQREEKKSPMKRH